MLDFYHPLPQKHYLFDFIKPTKLLKQYHYLEHFILPFLSTMELLALNPHALTDHSIYNNSATCI